MGIDINTVISKVIQLLLILLVGVYARKRKFINRDTVGALSRYLSNIANPLLILGSFQMEYSAELLKIGGKILLGAAVIHVLSAVVAYFVFKPKVGSNENTIYEFTSVFANCAFMGFPILAAIYGDIGVVYGSFYNAIFNLFFWTYGIYVLTRQKGAGKLDLKKLFLNPGVIATVLGIAFYVLQIRIPATLLGAMDMVGDSIFPLAMIVIGALIVELDFKTAFRDGKFWICSALKLLVVPILTLLGCLLFGCDTTVTYVLVILSGMPAATFGAIFAEIYDVNPVTAAKIVCLTTVLSIATIPMILYLSKLLLGM